MLTYHVKEYRRVNDGLERARSLLNVQKVHLQGGAKRLPNYHLVGENCVLVGENLFDLPDLVGENICLLKIYVD